MSAQNILRPTRARFYQIVLIPTRRSGLGANHPKLTEMGDSEIPLKADPDIVSRIHARSQPRERRPTFEGVGSLRWPRISIGRLSPQPVPRIGRGPFSSVQGLTNRPCFVEAATPGHLGRPFSRYNGPQTPELRKQLNAVSSWNKCFSSIYFFCFLALPLRFRRCGASYPSVMGLL